MAEIKRDEERERLTRWYGDMEEEELKEIAKREGALTDVAREVIRAELLRREFKVEQEALPESIAGNPEMKLAKIRDFTFVPDALVAKSVLDSAGIECFLSDETTSMISPCQEGKSSPDALRRSAGIKFLGTSARVRASRRWFLLDQEPDIHLLSQPRRACTED